MKGRKAVTREIAGRYQKATKRLKGAILDEFNTLTGYDRSYASQLQVSIPYRAVKTPVFLRGVKKNLFTAVKICFNLSKEEIDRNAGALWKRT